MPSPFHERRDLIVPLIGSVAFAGIPVAMFLTGATLNGLHYVSFGFGLIGLIAVGVQLAGFKPPEYQPKPSRKRSRASTATKPVHHQGPLPELSASKQAQVRRGVRIMAEAGVFGTMTPDPALLYAGIAAQEWSVLPDAILFALMEANYYHPDFDPAPFFDHVVLHDTQVETPAERVEEMIRDIARLSRGTLRIDDLVVEQAIVPDADRLVRTTATMTINGQTASFDEEHRYKQLPLTLHPVLAEHLPADRGLAVLWVDQGMISCVLTRGAVEAMNAGFKIGPKSRCEWAWIDAEIETAAA